MRIIPWAMRKPVFRPVDSDPDLEDIESLRSENSNSKDRGPRKYLFYDQRLDGTCIYCGATHDSDEHVPSRVFLDRPYPPNLPIVAACTSCNTSYSKDESYLAALLECVICGSVEPSDLRRPVIQKMLERSPALRSHLKEIMFIGPEGIVTQPDHDRVKRVLIKLAQGHIKYELAEIVYEADGRAWYSPLSNLSEEQLEDFENPSTGEIGVWPELGSRAFNDLIFGIDEEFGPFWWGVQEGRYRYWVDPDSPSEVRIVISEYLAVTVRFESVVNDTFGV